MKWLYCCVYIVDILLTAHIHRHLSKNVQVQMLIECLANIYDNDMITFMIQLLLFLCKYDP